MWNHIPILKTAKKHLKVPLYHKTARGMSSLKTSSLCFYCFVLTIKKSKNEVSVTSKSQFTLSSNLTIAGWMPGKGLWSVEVPCPTGRVTVSDDCNGTIMQLKSLEVAEAVCMITEYVVNTTRSLCTELTCYLSVLWVLYTVYPYCDFLQLQHACCKLPAACHWASPYPAVNNSVQKYI